MKNYKSVLLLKVPYCPYPDTSKDENDFRTKSTFRPFPSLALAALCAFIDKYKTNDYRLKAVDTNIEAYTKPGASIDTFLYPTLLADCIKNNNYDVLALSVPFVFNVRWADMAVKLSREYHPKAKIIFGGGYPTLFPERCLNEHDVDSVVIGEGEAALLNILNRYNEYSDPVFENKFPFEGYALRDENGKVIIYPKTGNFLNAEDLPVPAWDYLDVKKYFKNSGDSMLPIEGSRGCPYNCTYCCTYISWGRKMRYKYVDILIKEILEIKGKYLLGSLHFVDDNLSFSKEWFLSFFKRIIEVKPNLKISASNFSVKHIDEELVDIMTKVGMESITISVESGSAEIQRRINKNLNFEQVKNIVKMLKSKNLKIHVCWMLGFPGETIKQINETFDFARELKAHTNQFLTVLPYPGTQLFEEAKKAGILIFQEDSLDKFDNRKCDYLKSDEWNYKQLQEMIYDVNIELNFLNNPLLDTLENEQYMLDLVEKLLLKLPGHIIAHIVAGYIYKKKNMLVDCERHYQAAIKLFKNKILYNTFVNYLSWKHPIMGDFNQYLEIKAVKICADDGHKKRVLCGGFLHFY